MKITASDFVVDTFVEFADRACTVPIQFDKNKQAATKFQKLIGSKYSRLTYTKFDAGKQLLLQYKLQLLGKNNNKENLFNKDTKNK